jgi:cobalt transporter subunit CbtB
MPGVLTSAPSQTETGTTAVVSPKSASRVEMLAAAAIAASLGLAVIWGVGFSHIPAWHNAAHDTRHSMAFPCH